MKRIIAFFSAAALLLTACEKHEDVFFDTPFVSLSSMDKTSTSMVVDAELNNMLTEVLVTACVSSTYNSEPFTVEFEFIPGDGIKEGVDYKIQKSTSSPLTFEPGTYEMPIRIIWMKNKDFDPSKNNTLTIKLTGSSIPEMVLGYPGPDALRSSFTFYKQYI